jgi:transcriptional regulator
MYLPKHFAETDLARLDALIKAHPFVTLISTDHDGAPFVSHLPVLYRRDGDSVLIEGHWSRANPQARHSGAVLMIVHGPDTYISPGWYPDKEEAARVPTWNYAVAHLRGTLDVHDDDDTLGDLVDRLSQRFESTVGSDWRFDMARDDHRSQLRGIIGFRFVPTRIDLKFKLSQNHPPANIHAVREALSQLDDPAAGSVADLMAMP